MCLELLQIFYISAICSIMTFLRVGTLQIITSRDKVNKSIIKGGRRQNESLFSYHFSFLFFHPSFSFLCLFIYLPASLSVCFCVQRETTHAHKVQTCFRRISEVSSTHDAAVIFFLSNNSVSFSSLTADLRASDPNIGSRYADLSGLVL